MNQISGTDPSCEEEYPNTIPYNLISDQLLIVTFKLSSPQKQFKGTNRSFPQRSNGPS